mgnify:CR=1 FL=1
MVLYTQLNESESHLAALVALVPVDVLLQKLGVFVLGHLFQLLTLCLVADAL